MSSPHQMRSAPLERRRARLVPALGGLAIVVCTGILGLLAGSYHSADILDVIYVPTEQAVVERMLRMAEVSSHDLVYDLGCGDGRLVIAAAKLHGARGVGIDIDPQRIRESQENAARVGVADRVTFLVGDIFATDFRQATVVLLFLLPEVNLRLRPRLFQQLQPGTPVVSHNFDMADWKPDETEVIPGSHPQHVLYKWIIPANVAGVWKLESDSAALEMALEQRFQQVWGKIKTGGREVPLAAVQLRGDELRFSVPQTGEDFSARISQGSLHGVLSARGREGSPATGYRLPAPSQPIFD